VSVATTFNGNLIVGARAFHGNPYDGHTLSEQLDQATILMQDIDPENPIRPHTAFVDLGYQGVDADSPDVRIIHRGKFKSLTPDPRGAKETQAAAGYNLRWLLRMIARKGGFYAYFIFLRLFLWSEMRNDSRGSRLRVV
jgi:IS5 family transposase